MDCCFDEFSSTPHDMARLAQTRHHICAAVALQSKNATETIDLEGVKQANYINNKSKPNRNRGLLQQNLKLNSLEPIAFSDSNFANNLDYGTLLGYVILLKYITNKAW